MDKKGANHWNWKGGKNNCAQCHKPLSHYGKYCRECWGKTMSGKNSPHYKHGNSVSGDFLCVNCNKEKVIRKHHRCYSCANKLSNHPNWKGGVSSLSTLIKNLEEYKNWRKAIYVRDNYTCIKCKTKGIKLEAHHKIPFSILLKDFLQMYAQFSPFEDKETLVRLSITYRPFWDTENGETKCKICHRSGHPRHCKPLKQR